jgi:hypothetical protein
MFGGLQWEEKVASRGSGWAQTLVIMRPQISQQRAMKTESNQETAKVKMAVWGGVEERKWPKRRGRRIEKRMQRGGKEWAYRHSTVGTFVTDLYSNGRFRYGNTAEAPTKHDAPSISLSLTTSD